MISTRMSFDIATIILRTVSACALSPYLTLSSLVTPSTSIAISSPNASRSSSSVYSVSSTVSCRSAAAIVFGTDAEVGEDLGDGDRMRDVRLAAERRFCPAWAFSATAYARSISERSALGWCSRTVRMRVSTAPAGCAREKMRGTRRRSDAVCGVEVSTMSAPPLVHYPLRRALSGAGRSRRSGDHSGSAVVADHRSTGAAPGIHAARDVRRG